MNRIVAVGLTLRDCLPRPPGRSTAATWHSTPAATVATSAQLNNNGYAGTYITLAAPGAVTVTVNAQGTAVRRHRSPL